MNKIPELVTSLKRHYNNNFRDPLKQCIIDLFLGVFRPQESLVEISQGTKVYAKLEKMQEFPQLEQQLHNKANENLRLGFDGTLDVESRFWWEIYFTAFEQNLPQPL